jgi:hypothetical protein
MIVKIGNSIFSPEDTAIMVILTEQDKANIAAHGAKGAMKYCAVPAKMKRRELKEFMKLKQVGVNP